MIKIIILASVLMVAISIGNVSAAVLSSPNEGTVYKSGESIPVKVDISQNEQIESIWLYTLQSQNSIVLKSPPFEVIFKASDKYIGDDEITAAVKYTDGTLTTIEKNIKITLKDGIVLQTITYYQKHEVIRDTDSTKNISSLYGMYSDGVERELPNAANSALEYSSDDPSIVEIDNTGKMISRKLGDTFITIKSGNVSFKLPLMVYITLDPPKNFKAVSTPTEIQMTWELSPNDPKWVTGYKIFRTESPVGFPKNLLTTVAKGTTSFIDVSATPGKTYYYCVQAIASTIAEVSKITSKEIGKLLTP